MSDASNPDPFILLVDLVVIVTAVAILGYGVIKSIGRNNGSLPFGGPVIAAGLVLAGVAILAEFALHFLGARRGDLASHLAPISTESFSLVLSRLAFVLFIAGFVMLLMARRRIESDLDISRLAIEDLEVGQRYTDLRFQYLFNTTSNAMYSYEFDPPMAISLSRREQVELSYGAVLSQCNRVFARELGASRPEAVVGQSWSQLESSQDTDAHENMLGAFIDNDYRISNYPLVFRTRSGVERVINVSMIGIVRDGFLERVWGVESNTLEFRQARDELRRRQRFEQFSARVSSRLLTAAYEDADAAVRETIVEICDYVEADRALMSWLDDGSREKVSVPYVYSKVGAPFDGTISEKEFPRSMERILNNEIVVIDDVQALASDYNVDRKNFEKFDVKSTIMLPMIVDGELVGSMVFSRVVQQRDWGHEAAQDLRALSQLLANFVLRLRSQRELNTALQSLQRATDRLEAENVYLREAIDVEHGFDDIVGKSQPMLRCLQLVEQVADTMTPVLILGETGTGKELIARAIHNRSDRRDRPLVKVNCAALPANLIESELFGHEKGAFTGADSRKRGRFDLANGSTLFLDEIGEIPIELQAKLLRVLQEGEYERLGGTKTIATDTRIIAATNLDLDEAVRNGDFRSDLYYRINTFPIELPALRDRGEDIEMLCRHFVEQHSHRLGRHIEQISSEMMRQLRMYDWPGNVRELEGIVQRALISSNGTVLDLSEPLIEDGLNDEPRILSSTIPELKLVERDHIVSVLDSVGWKIAGAEGAAALLGMPPSTLRSRMKKLGIERQK